MHFYKFQTPTQREREGEDFVTELCLSQFSVVCWQKAFVWTISKTSVWKAAKGSTKEQAQNGLLPFTFDPCPAVSYFVNLKSWERMLSHPVCQQPVYSTGTAWQDISRSPDLELSQKPWASDSSCSWAKTATFWLVEISVGLYSNHQSFNSLSHCALHQSINTQMWKQSCLN